MSDFDKARIGFALALLGTVFTVHPILAPELDRAIELPFAVVPVRAFYLVFIALLVVSVYCFALDMVYGKPVSRLRTIGTTVYAIALIVPVFTAALAVVAWSVRLLAPYREVAASVLAYAAGVLTSLGAARQTLRIRRAMLALESEAREVRATADEATYLTRAEEMLRLGHFDLAAIEAWRAIEIAVATALYRQKPLIPVAVQPRAQLDQALHMGIIPKDFGERAQWLRRLRNEAAHGGGSIAEADARRSVEDAVKILGAIARPEIDTGDA